MQDVFSPPTDAEFERLGQFLLDRIDDDVGTEEQDEGVLDVSELDGFLTAIVSGPAAIMPSQWLPALWGDFEPVWTNTEEAQEILMLMMRHMNSIAAVLTEQPDEFEPLFMEHHVDGKTYTVVDDWCEGYLRGVALSAANWVAGGDEIATLLAPILAFTSQTDWKGHDYSDQEVAILVDAITTNVREIHKFWLAGRESEVPKATGTQSGGPRPGRNDPCPCGSGEKYKKCCLN